MICPVVSKEHFRSMRITLAFSVIALSFCIAFAVLTFAGILAQYTAVRELRVVTLMVGNFGGMYGKLKPENFICLSLDGQIPAPETRLTELYGSLDCLTFAYTKEAMTFLNQKIPPAV